MAQSLVLNLPSLHPGQQTVLAQARRFNILMCGRRWRKTTLAMRLSVKGALAEPPKPFLWTAPVYDQVRIGWNETKKAVGHIADFNQSIMSAIYPNGAVNIYRSAEKEDNLRGHTAFGVIADEAPFIDEDAYYKVIRPFVMDTGGPVWLLGTPNGMNWIWREFMRGLEEQEKPDSNIRVWQAPTVGCEIVDGKLVRKPHPLENPSIPFSEIEDLYHTMPEQAFRQEILAEFIEDGGGVFHRVNQAIRSKERENEPYQPQYSYQMGVDLGRINDYTVISVVRLPDLRQVYWQRFNALDWDTQIPKIEAVARAYHARVILDSGGVGDPIYQMLVRRGVSVYPFKWSNAAKQHLIDNLALLIEQAPKPFLMDVPVQTNELLAYQYEKTPSGMTTMSAPKGLHDDCVISLALSTHGRTRLESVNPDALIPISIGKSEFSALTPGSW